MQSEKEPLSSDDMELSIIWQELLGGQLHSINDADASRDSKKAEETELPPETEAHIEAIPTLSSDPWSALIQARGTEMVELSQLHLHMSDQDVEQALQLMQEDHP